MLGAIGSPEEIDPSSHRHHHRCRRQIQLPPTSFSYSAFHMRQLLISCAELISQSDLSAAHRLLTVLSSANSSASHGDSTERLVHQFTKALSLRLRRLSPVPPSSSVSFFDPSEEQTLVQSSYLSLNQVTPFIRFTHLTANQAILEAVEGHQSIHIVDFDIMHGVQWPPLMQAIASSAETYPPPILRITGAGNDLDILQRTGDRLSKFAFSLGLHFQFQPLLLNDDDDPASVISSDILLFPNETLAVNCVLYLHRLLKNRETIFHFLRRIKSMNPNVVTLAEREANHNNPIFLERFLEALNHYGAVFDSLEATLPPSSQERLAVEQVWFGKEIADILAGDGDTRRERHERYRCWEVMVKSSGFYNVPLSHFAVSQAKLLLRLHYPSEGYQLRVLNGSLFLGWRNQPLFSISSWH